VRIFVEGISAETRVDAGPSGGRVTQVFETQTLVTTLCGGLVIRAEARRPRGPSNYPDQL